jgi:hypothetical protein
VVDRKVHEVPEPRRPYASASDTPSSTKRLSPSTVILGHGVPKCITSTATLLDAGGQEVGKSIIFARNHEHTWARSARDRSGDRGRAQGLGVTGARIALADSSLSAR